MSLNPMLTMAAAVSLTLAQASAAPGSKDWSGVATIGGGVAAQLGCAGVFVSGRPASEVERDDVHGMNPLLGAARITVDPQRRTVTAVALPNTPPRVSFWRPGVGCTLAAGAPPATAQEALPACRSEASAVDRELGRRETPPLRPPPDASSWPRR